MRLKTLLFSFSAVFFLFSCSKKTAEITVENPSDLNRENEMVEFTLSSVYEILNLQDGEQVIILDSAGEQIPCQLLSDGETIVFPATVAAKSATTYRVQTGTPDSIAPCTFARQVPERKDDFAWENDRVAFRMYGPALANENPSNGVDMWLKRGDSLIVNKWYKNDLENGISYHVDNGEGLDCYKVAHTLGAGGIAPYVDSTLWVGNFYNSFDVVESGPLRTVFSLTYDSLYVGSEKIANQSVRQIIQITIDAGSQLNMAEVIYEGGFDDSLAVAAGIYLHEFGNSNGKGVACAEQQIMEDKELGMIALAEDAVSDAGVLSGRSYLGIIVPSAVEAIKTDSAANGDKHLIAVGTSHNYEPFTYYFGGGWSEGGFASDEEWFQYMKEAQIKISQPLTVSVK